MKFIYAVSPDFLKPLAIESKEFSFAIRGYCSVKQGIKNLKFSNQEDLLGYVLLFYELPREVSPLIDLIHRIDFVSKKGTPVVFCSMFKDGVSLVLKNLDLRNIELSVYTDLESMTDIDIKREIFGTILKANYTPYIEGENNNVFPTRDKPNTYRQLMPPDILLLNEEIVPAPSAEMCMKADNIINHTRDSNEIIFMLRTMQINKKFGIKINNDNVFNSLLSTVNKDNKLLYRLCYDLIKEGRL